MKRILMLAAIAALSFDCPANAQDETIAVEARRPS